MKERNILWRYFTAVNENIANSDVCRKEILCCGSKTRRKKEESRKRSKNIPLAYSGENNVSIMAYIRCSVVVLIN